MADRLFKNEMPDFVQENPNTSEEGFSESHAQGTHGSLLRFFSQPYSSLSLHLQRAALDRKETTWGLSRQRVEDYTLYAGSLGTAYLLFKSFQVTHNKNDLILCLEIIKACDSSSLQSRGGVCAVGALAAKHVRDDKLFDYYLSQFKEIELSKDHPDEYYTVESDTCGRVYS